MHHKCLYIATYVHYHAHQGHLTILLQYSQELMLHLIATCALTTQILDTLNSITLEYRGIKHL